MWGEDMKKKILVNAYFAMNLGDDLFLKILFDRYPQIKWELLTPNNKYKEIFSKYKNVSINKTLSLNLGIRKVNLFKKMNDWLLKYRKYDALVIIGGSIFMEQANWKENLSERGSLPRIFKSLNKKAFIIGSNFGPYKDELYVEKHRELFSKFNDICFRDRYSHSLFRELNNVRIAPDVVFNLKIDPPDIKEKSVGFSIIDIEKRKGLKECYEAYNEKMIELAERYVYLGYKIKLFSFCEVEGDLRIAKYIASKMNNKYSIHADIVNYEGNINEFLNEFKSCEVIIGTRFHSIILGLLLEQAVFPIIYSDKTYNVLRDLDIADNYCYITDILNMSAEDVVSKAVYNKLKCRDVFIEAEKQFEKLDMFVG